MPDAYVLAADTVVALGRRVLPKAEDDAEVRACLELLSGPRAPGADRRRRRRARMAGARERLVESRVRFKRLTAGGDRGLSRLRARGWARPAATPSRAGQAPS